ncbi:hypothetical protein HBH1_01710 [Herbaspirillum sp. BH-1]|uniref:Glycine zipper domain-containing protein n=1 Tax=Herbaspirillum frisingense TaxID=92645 RepID=A0ABU1P9C6_9BURK|nr:MULTISPECIES: hypothetical protein [Herbaspirillum]MDR6582515.1 hypothetical protein [Herbaspirillum frisingense]PLY59783.1 hypothetical protein HBH1_01710 [Herbaspirillum sp. BH-1]
MGSIIAARFELQDEAARAVKALVDAGFARERISSFFVNPAGQHDRFAVGGDRDKSPGAEETDKGAAAGVAAGAGAGAVAGVAAAPVAGPLGPVLGGLVGGHLGGLVGSLSATDDDPVPRRVAGMLVAVQLDESADVVDSADFALEQRAMRVLQDLQGTDLERAEGQIRDGDWIDFDPLIAPQWVQGGVG